MAMNHNHLPPVNISDDFTRALLSVLKFQILIDPCDNVVLECSLNQLMKKIRCNKFVDVSTRKVRSERLSDHSKPGRTEKNERTHAPRCR